MKTKSAIYRRAALRIVLVLAAFVFWGMFFPFALAWHEQFQLFLFDGAYLAERLSVPGGAMAYVSEFLVQFYNNPYLGAGGIALVFLLLQTGVWQLMKRDLKEQSDFLFVLSFLPSLFLWYVTGNENVMLAFPVSLILALVAMWFCPAGGWRCMLYAVISIPVVYWLAGPVVIALTVYVFAEEIRHTASLSRRIGMGLLPVFYTLFIILLSSWAVPYPLRRLWGGLYYFRIPEVLPYSFIMLAVLCLLLILSAASIERKWVRLKRQNLFTAAGTVVMAVAAFLAIPLGFEKKTYELIEYDYLVRLQRWNDIIRKAGQRQPDLPMSVCAVNLALGMTNQLGERAFDFFQNGPEGLLPAFSRDFNSTQLTGEAYFRLGLVNTAQRFAFEAMEAIPNYQKSGRVIKRLAETNLINGQYKVTGKYLKMLRKTLFYRKWAESRMEMLADTTLIDRHPLYGRLRRMRLDDDFLFSETELDKICGQLFARDSGNTLAMQYLLLYPLLARDIDRFMNYFGYVNSVVRYNPVVCREALAFASMMRKSDVPPGLIGNDVMLRLKSFAQSYTFNGKDSRKMEGFRRTLWYYLMIEK